MVAENEAPAGCPTSVIVDEEREEGYNEYVTVKKKGRGLKRKAPANDSNLRKEKHLSEAEIEAEIDAEREAEGPHVKEAEFAGTGEASKCTLIITEGVSAMELVDSSIEVLDREFYGVFALRGKLLNTRNASDESFRENTELQSLMRVIGLKEKGKYENVDNLRYGRVMILTDQDVDGYHIKGLIISLFEDKWPTLLKMKSFLQVFFTPTVKAISSKNEEFEFYCLQHFNDWLKIHQGESGWEYRFYKGLGSHLVEEGEKFFRNADKYTKDFVLEEGDEDLIDMMFRKKRAPERRSWIENSKGQQDIYFDSEEKYFTFKKFMQTELIHFARANILRSIPSVVDGLACTPRKILFSAFKLQKDVKAFRLSSAVLEYTSYHHGSKSLDKVIVRMSQNHVGSNNMNLLTPLSNFGTAAKKGKDAADQRYLNMKLSSLARCLFLEEDDCVLTFLEEGGKSVEPKWFAPLLPIVLINGATGIAMGYSSSVPPHNPMDVLENIRRLLRGEDPRAMTPWYRDFTGKIEEMPRKEGELPSYKVFGNMERQNNNEVIIKELPIGQGTHEEYKSFLKRLEERDDSFIKSFRKRGSEFHIEISDDKFIATEDLYEILKLTTVVGTSNMRLHDANGELKQYNSTIDILRDFCDARIEFYKAKKPYLLKDFRQKVEDLQNKIKYVVAVAAQDIHVGGSSSDAARALLQCRGLRNIDVLRSLAHSSSDDERIREDFQTLENLEKKIKDLEEEDAQSMWLADLEKLEEQLLELETLRVTGGGARQ